MDAALNKTPPELKNKILEYIALDHDELTRKEAQDLVLKFAGADNSVLEELFMQRLQFGTAGLRARMGAGYSRMNSLTIYQSTKGLVDHLIEEFGIEKVQNKGVVIGYDHRHNSLKFAQYILN
jgi:phosphomannomutase